MDKNAREIEVFNRFVNISGLPIDINSIKKAAEPAPDIYCRDNLGNELAFELVELLDSNFATMIDWATDGKDSLYSLYENLSADKKAALDSKYAHADIYFDVCHGVTKNKLKQQMNLIFDELIQLPENAEGDIRNFSDKRVSKLINFIRIFRSSINGPLFSTNTGAWMGDPTPDALTEKFSKKYQCNYPIELVAYIEKNPMFHETVWRPKTIRFFESNKDFGPFRKVWIVDLNKEKVEFLEHAA